MGQQTVYVPAGDKRGGIYHSDKDCRNIPEKVHTRPISYANRAEWRECKVCAGSVHQPENIRKSLRDMVATNE